MVDEYCNETKFTLPAYGGKVRKKIVIISNQAITRGTRQLFGLDRETGKIVNIVGKKLLPAGLVYESNLWKKLTPKTVVEGEFLKISGLNINTLQLVSGIRILETVDLSDLRKEFKENGRDFVSNFSDIHDFIKAFPKANGHALLYLEDAWVIRNNNNKYLLVTPQATIQMHHKYVHDPQRSMYCGFVLVRFYSDIGKIFLTVERLWNQMLSYNPKHVVNPESKKKNISTINNRSFFVRYNKNKPISPVKKKYVCEESIREDSLLELEYLRSRHVKNLVHFTHINNLRSILRLGLLPRNRIPQFAIYNDEQRLDGHCDCNCLSVTFPNYKMFYQKTAKYPRSDYIILGFTPEFLTTTAEKNVAYFPANAATKSYREEFKNHTGLKNLKKMFENPKPDLEYIRPATLPDCLTTNPQAEILLRGSLSPSYINKIYIFNEAAEKRVKYILDQYGVEISTEIKKELYELREDYKLWIRQDDTEKYYR